MKRESKHLLYDLRPDQYSLRGIWLLAVLYFGSLVAGAALSLIAFRLTHHFDPDASSYLASKPYTKFFDRARWVSVLILLPYLFLKCRLTRFRDIGFARPFLSTYLRWFVSGIAMIFIIYGYNTLTGTFRIDEQWSSAMIWRGLGEALLASILIGCLEEIVFRGLVFRMFYTAVKPVAAIVLSSLFFAILHFNASELSLGATAPSEVGLSEAASIAWGTAIAVFTEFDLKYLLALLLVGVVLHQVFLLSGNLWASIGIHAGWVFTIKLFGQAFETTEQADAFSGTTRVADGYWVSVVLIIFVVLFGYLLKRKYERRGNAG